MMSLSLLHTHKVSNFPLTNNDNSCRMFCLPHLLSLDLPGECLPIFRTNFFDYFAVYTFGV